MKPRYEHRCARFCKDAKGAPRLGTQWVHYFGRTLWVCDVCARQLFPKGERRRPRQSPQAQPQARMDPLPT